MGTQMKPLKYLNFARDIVEMLERGLEKLKYSFKKVSEISLEKENFEEEELETIEALCSRFARLSDMLLQKAFRFIDIYELYDPDISVLDRIQNAERRHLIGSAEEFKYIRQLRNEIAHNYAMENFVELFKEIIAFTPILINNTETTIEFIKKKVIKY